MNGILSRTLALSSSSDLSLPQSEPLPYICGLHATVPMGKKSPVVYWPGPHELNSCNILNNLTPSNFNLQTRHYPRFTDVETESCKPSDFIPNAIYSRSYLLWSLRILDRNFLRSSSKYQVKNEL